ncbi:hypothetical protein OS493_030769 [Desmophyllum pertusum]|uniref:Uncharacterized protein n=1 Tax=Desmophyllum pertusum TaxID=174260 RepID=A0A9W9YWD1_9CNID|nr:hypothetical protein OS493_030769 [Desmophyllum pertusum]
MPSSHNDQVERDSCSSTDNSLDDGSEGHSRLGSSYEIPFIPDYDEVPERPVSLKSDKGKIAPPPDVARKGSAERSKRELRFLLLLFQAGYNNGRTPPKIEGVIVFIGSPAVVHPIEVLGSSSAAEDSTASSVMSSSSSQIPVPCEADNSENKSKPIKSVSSPSLSRPRSASSRTNTPSVMRSQSLSSATLASSPKTSASPRVSRSKTMSAALRRSYPAATESDKKPSDIARRRGPISSTSDDSDVESSDTSQTRQIKRLAEKER